MLPKSEAVSSFRLATVLATDLLSTYLELAFLQHPATTSVIPKMKWMLSIFSSAQPYLLKVSVDDTGKWENLWANAEFFFFVFCSLCSFYFKCL
ncbi:hypothetical protein CEXT_494281 [Caerostris extrusa]|uniref:Uncharacterized protein n=1 Tax=Caerostris extrusa TaxID=172846 RepID=A0AAV4YFY7_CAEEX|nr:hypothetical protein CEXT_494281 [Caerostris extrusa]